MSVNKMGALLERRFTIYVQYSAMVYYTSNKTRGGGGDKNEMTIIILLSPTDGKPLQKMKK